MQNLEILNQFLIFQCLIRYLDIEELVINSAFGFRNSTLDTNGDSEV